MTSEDLINFVLIWLVGLPITLWDKYVTPIYLRWILLPIVFLLTIITMVVFCIPLFIVILYFVLDNMVNNEMN